MKKSLIIIMALLLFALLFSAEGQTEPYESDQIFVDPGFLSLTFYTMLVDPGHGGSQSGNVGRVYGPLEKDANLRVGLASKNLIKFTCKIIENH
jgi:N-acetylmuramoyl-L-alanine amidase